MIVHVLVSDLVFYRLVEKLIKDSCSIYNKTYFIIVSSYKLQHFNNLFPCITKYQNFICRSESNHIILALCVMEHVKKIVFLTDASAKALTPPINNSYYLWLYMYRPSFREHVKNKLNNKRRPLRHTPPPLKICLLDFWLFGRTELSQVSYIKNIFFVSFNLYPSIHFFAYSFI